MELADRVLKLINDDDIEENIPTTFCKALDELREAVYLRATDEIDDDQLFDTLCYTTTVVGALLACMGYDLDTLKTKYTTRMKLMEEAINDK